MQDLPRIMVAPNGARRTKADHPELPVEINEIVECASSCFLAGAEALHAHVRDRKQNHVLDAGLYKELISEMAGRVPDMLVQITTESVGKYASSQMRKLVRDVKPQAVSVSVSEMLADGDEGASRKFYFEALENKISIQHILYSADHLIRFFDLVERKIIPGQRHQLLFVLGRYTMDQESMPTDLDAFLSTLRRGRDQYDWAVCAFGRNETTCLEYALKNAGKVRVGFENSLINKDGSIAKNNAERVLEIHNLLLPSGAC